MYLGADPEFFLVSNTTGKIVPASEAGLLNGKTDLTQRLISNSGLSAYRDGYTMEINFQKAHICRGLMGNAFRNGIIDFLFKDLKNQYTISSIPAFPVKLEDIEKLPPDVAMFGCSSSKNAWGESLDISLVDGLSHPWRYAGGHLWISNFITECPWLGNTEGQEQYVRALDYYLGLPFAYIFNRPEAYIRRRMYGRAGDYRTRDFGNNLKGIEYRVLSSEWFNHASWFSFVLGIARFLATRMSYIDHKSIKERGKEIQAAINEGIGLEKMLPERLYSFYVKENLIAYRKILNRFDFTMLQCTDVHNGWDYWNIQWGISNFFNSNFSSVDFSLN